MTSYPDTFDVRDGDRDGELRAVENVDEMERVAHLTNITSMNKNGDFQVSYGYAKYDPEEVRPFADRASALSFFEDVVNNIDEYVE